MVNRFFIEKISSNFPYSFTNDQAEALEKITGFLFQESVISCFYLLDMPGRGNHRLLEVW